jgi:hypothetical protein
MTLRLEAWSGQSTAGNTYWGRRHAGSDVAVVVILRCGEFILGAVGMPRDDCQQGRGATGAVAKLVKAVRAAAQTFIGRRRGRGEARFFEPTPQIVSHWGAKNLAGG